MPAEILAAMRNPWRGRESEGVHYCFRQGFDGSRASARGRDLIARADYARPARDRRAATHTEPAADFEDFLAGFLPARRAARCGSAGTTVIRVL